MHIRVFNISVHSVCACALLLINPPLKISALKAPNAMSKEKPPFKV